MRTGPMAEALRFLDSRGETRWELGLDRIRGLLSRMGDPQRAYPSIHVAGTNGKGSFCALLSSVLREAGLHVGLYTSPHLLDIRERIAVDGKAVSVRDFASAVAAARDAEKDPATYFELLTAAAFQHFREAGVDVAVIETGLGGRLDATNALEAPLLTVITSIGFDHTAHLGKTLAVIAAEKAGILKPGVPCLCGERAQEPRSVIRRRAREVGARVIEAVSRLESVRPDWRGGEQRVVEGGGKGRGFVLPLLGSAALRNAALALDAVDVLRERGLSIPADAVERGLESARWPGRFQVVEMPALPVAPAGHSSHEARARGSVRGRGRVLVLDGAHNVPAMRAFLETWTSSPFSRNDALFLVGMLADKDVDGMLGLLAPLARRAVAVRADSPRALGCEELARRMESRGMEVVARAECARDAIKVWEADGARIAALCGSFYLVGDALKVLGKRRLGGRGPRRASLRSPGVLA